MKIQKIVIKNFRSIYGEQVFDFSELDGLVKLSGVVGSGKTTVGEAILWGLYGKVKEHKNPNLVSWHVKNAECTVEMDLVSKNKQIHIRRNMCDPLEITIDGKTLSASNKHDTQEILEEEYLDVPKLAVEKMCIISFNAFKNSLAAMNPGETRQFTDEVFGFKTFTEYNDEIISERKLQLNENNQLTAVLNETVSQVQHLSEKKKEQQLQLSTTIDIEKLNKDRQSLIEEGVNKKNEFQSKKEELNKDGQQYNTEKQKWYDKKMESATLGKQHKEWIKKFERGICPTCGHSIEVSTIEEHKNNMMQCASNYREYEAEENKYIEKINQINKEISSLEQTVTSELNEIKKKITDIDSQIKIYNNSVELLNENYDSLISEYEDKITNLEEQIRESDKNIGEWNEMNELFSKTLRYGLLDTLIPHINKSIKYYMNKLGQEYTVEYDQEFKPHIYIENNIKEISYSDLSTGQKKTLDVAIIFGVIANVIANVDFNIFFLDELFSNMDSNSRNIMLQLLQDTLKDNRTIFVVNHAEMPDDYFDHKMRVHLESKKVIEKKEEFIVSSSKYEKIF